MTILATLWFPSLNPIGPSSILALVLVTTLAVQTSSLSAMPERRRRAVVLVLPPILLAIGWFLGEFLRGRFPMAQDFVAGYICIAFAFGFGMHAIRFPTRSAGLLSFLYTWVLGALIVWVAVETSWWFLIDIKWLSPNRIHWLPLYAIASFAGFWPLVFRRLRSKLRARNLVEQGLCSKCEYDLRGSVGRPVCPECGHPIDEQKQRPYLRSLT